MLQIVDTKNPNQLFAQYCNNTTASIIHKKSKTNLCTILRQNCRSYYSQRIKTKFLQNTATKLLQLVFAKNQKQNFHNSATKLPHVTFTTFYTIL
jgi:hypothetical protein